MGMDDFSNPNHPPSPPTYNYNPLVSMPENPPSPSTMSAYPEADLNGRPMHVSPYSSPPVRPIQPYSMQQQHLPNHDSYSPSQNQSQQQYSYDNIQLRYPVPSPQFPVPNMVNRFEPPRDQRAPLPPMSMMPAGAGYSSGGSMEMGGVDTTGQMPPPGVKPRVTATLWEDEGTMCFQVDVNGICVARREGVYSTSMCCVTA